MISADNIERVVRPFLEKDLVHLCEIKVSGRAGKPLIQLFLDLEIGNITIDACTGISRQVQDLLDMQDWIPGNYQLIVSSPGIDFPLREIWQFRKNIGRFIEHRQECLPQPDGILRGRVKEIEDNGSIRLEVDGDIREYTLKQLSGAKVVIEIPHKGSKNKRGYTG
ncbi:hypothetical protein HQ587_01530 [bacterium]|nr:hypothetical protein [bacterium]